MKDILKRTLVLVSIVSFVFVLFVVLSNGNDEIQALDVGYKLSTAEMTEIKEDQLIFSEEYKEDTGKNDRSILSTVIQIEPKTLGTGTNKFYFKIPNGLKALYKTTEHNNSYWKFIEDEIITISRSGDNWVFTADEGLVLARQNFKLTTEEKYWAKIYLYEDSVKIFTNTNESGFVTWDTIASSGTRVLGNSTVDRADYYLPKGMRHEWYYDQEFTIPVQYDDLVTADTHIFGKAITYDDLITINFDTRGGSEIPAIERVASEYGIDGMWNSYTLPDIGIEVADLPIPVRDGYIFDEWLYDKYNPGDGYSIFDNTYFKGNELKFYATWIEIAQPVKVIFDNPKGAGTFEMARIDGYESPNRPYILINPGELIPQELIPIITQNPKYEFIGFDFDFSNPIKYETVIKIKYKRFDEFTITYNTNGGISIPSEELKWKLHNGIEEFESRLPIATKARHAFVGWYLDQDLTIEAPKTVDTRLEENRMFYDITLYAKYLFNGVRLNHETNWNEYQIGPIIITKNEEFIAPPPPLRLGYDFIGWFLDYELTLEYDGNGFDEDEVTIYAKWERNDVPIPPDIEEDDSLTKDQVIIFVGIGIGIAILSLVLFGGRRRRKR